jgi:5-methylthioribose kinase
VSEIPRQLLIALGIDPESVTTCTSLGGGVSANIWRLDKGRETVVIKQALEKLKVKADWHADPRRALSEIEWHRFVDSLLPGSVPKVTAVDLEHHAFCMPYLEYPLWKAELLKGTIDRGFARLVANRLAVIHSASTHQPEIARQFAHDALFTALRIEPYFLATANKNPDLADSLQRLGYSLLDNKLALMQGDISPKNILKGPQGPIFLDAETACFGDPAFDMAFCLTHLMLKCLLHPKLAPGFTDTVKLMFAEYLGGVDWEPAADIGSRICRLLVAIMLARVDGKSPVEYLDPDNQALVRMFCRQALAAESVDMETITMNWCRRLGTLNSIDQS